MKVLVACEFSGVVRRAFRAKGHQAFSCDLLPSEDGNTEHHHTGDIFQLLNNCWYFDELGRFPTWDILIAHPPCTFLCSSGLHWNKRRLGRAAETEKALAFVKRLLDVSVEKIALENPIGCISSRIRKPDQIIQPYQFGHDASKATCLWLKGLPKLVETVPVPGRMVNGKPRWGNQTDSGQNKLAPSDTRWMDRSITYSGIAQAMADQWGSL